MGVYHPPSVNAMTEEALCAEMVQDIEVGGDGTNIKCGVIGEVGTSYPMTG